MDFVVLPDCPEGAVLAAAVPASQRIDYPSGRPWMTGTWDPRDATVVTAGPRKLVILGPATADEPAAAASLARLGSLHDLDQVASRLSGAFHLCAAIDGSTRLQGSVAGVRQVYSAVVNGVTVAANGVEPLMRLAGTYDLDEAILASRLLAPAGPPWPLALSPVRRGVHPLKTAHWLRLDPDGRSRQYRWWQPPPATLSLAEGAEAVRSALTAALASRIAASTTISADLSGGLDSTCLCFLAVGGGADLVTYHVSPLDIANSDTAWAEKAAALLPSARHRTLLSDRAENWFNAGYTPDRPEMDPEGPATWAAGLAHVQDLAARAVAEGSRTHLCGFGGDELFGRMPASPWSLWRARPVGGLRLVNRYRLANRWSAGGTFRSLLDRSTFAESLLASGNRIGEPPAPVAEPDFGWVAAPRMPPWATEDAVAMVRNLLLEAADSAPEPLDGDRARHQVLASLVFEGSTIRQINTVLADRQISWDAPFLDDRVIEAALSTRIEDRLAGGRYKPLLATAVQDRVPADILGRGDKGEFSAEGFRGLRHNRERLLELCEDSRLARLGLIDAAAFRSALREPGLMSHDLQPIQTTVACESWLRSHSWSPARRTGESR